MRGRNVCSLIHAFGLLRRPWAELALVCIIYNIYSRIQIWRTCIAGSRTISASLILVFIPLLNLPVLHLLVRIGRRGTGSIVSVHSIPVHSISCSSADVFQTTTSYIEVMFYCPIDLLQVQQFITNLTFGTFNCSRYPISWVSQDGDFTP